MSIHLVGGGRADDYSGEVFEVFLEEAAARASASDRTVPRIAVLLVGADDEVAEAYRSQLARVAPSDPVMELVEEGGRFESRVLDGIDALLVGGGHTPSYLVAVEAITDEIRLLVADGLPYLGFSAGAMIAADAAIIGGWLVGDVAVCPEETAEDLDEVTIAEGLGLVDLAVDVHAAQWGTLGRLIAATEAGLIDGGVAIDEFTALVVGEGALRVVGSGSVWRIVPGEDGVVVGTLGS